MKKNNTSTLFTLVVMILIGTSLAFSTYASNFDNTTMSSQNSDPENWTLIQTENGIAISFSRVQSNGETFLKIKFENNSVEKVQLIWSLLKDSERIVFTKDEMEEQLIQIDASELSFYDGTYLVSINEDESFANFSVVINIIK